MSTIMKACAYCTYNIQTGSREDDPKIYFAKDLFATQNTLIPKI